MLLGSSVAEQVAVNHLVAGSIPARAANYPDHKLPMPEFHVYILENIEGRFYIGQTENLEKRILDHNRTDCVKGKFARKNGPWKLVWHEQHPSRSSAMIREKEIKAWKSTLMIKQKLLNT